MNAKLMTRKLISFVMLISLFFISRQTGFSVGDELGFPESLGNVEGSKRRALNYRTGANTIGVLPAAQMPVRFIVRFFFVLTIILLKIA